MTIKTFTLAALTALFVALLAVGCASQGPSGTTATQTTTNDTTSLYIDVHELGAGKVTAAAVAEAHEQDLAVQGRHGVTFEKYWVDEAEGKIYCLSRAPRPEAVVETHREAHGLLPSHVWAVSDGEAAAALGGRKMFLDVHHLGPGQVTAAAVAEAHQKDLAVEREHGVRFLQYWVDEKEGTVMCLSEAENAADVTATHAQAHGLLPDEVLQVSQGG